MKVIRLPLDGTSQIAKSFLKHLRSIRNLCNFNTQFDVIGDFGIHSVSSMSR